MPFPVHYHPSISSICAILKSTIHNKHSMFSFVSVVFSFNASQSTFMPTSPTRLSVHKPTQHAINPTTSSQPTSLSNANTLHRSSVVRLVLIMTKSAMGLTLFPPILFPVDNQTSCHSWHQTLMMHAFVVVCWDLSGKAHLAFCSSSKPCTVMPLVSCPLVCLFSHVHIHHITISTQQWLNEHKLEQFTAKYDVLFFNASTIKSMHPFSIWHSVFTNTLQPHPCIHTGCFESHTWHIKRWTVLCCAQCFSNCLLFIVLIVIHEVLSCFCLTEMSFKQENGNEMEWCQNKNEAFISSLTTWFWCHFAF